MSEPATIPRHKRDYEGDDSDDDHEEQEEEEEPEESDDDDQQEVDESDDDGEDEDADDEEEEEEDEEDDEDEEEEEEDEESDEEDEVVLKITIAGETVSRILHIPEDTKLKTFAKLICHKCKVPVPNFDAKPSKKSGKKAKGSSTKSSSSSKGGDADVGPSTMICYLDADGDSVEIDSKQVLEQAYDFFWNGEADSLKIVVHPPGKPGLGIKKPSFSDTRTKGPGGRPPKSPSQLGGTTGGEGGGANQFNSSTTAGSTIGGLGSPVFLNSQLMRCPTPVASSRNVSSEILMGRTGSNSNSDIIVSEAGSGGHSFDGLQAGQELLWHQINVLGRGSFGVVYEGLTQDGILMAVKVVDMPPESANSEEITTLMKEINLLRSLNHRNVVAYYGCQTSPLDNGGLQLQIFLEHCPGGSLGTLRKKYDKVKGRLSVTLVRHYARSVLEGLCYLHSQGIIHRDIKCENVLIGATGEVKLADFGCSRRVGAALSESQGGEGDMAKTLVGTPLFMAPEMVNSEDGKGYSYEADVWGLGCLAIEMFGRKPWITDGNNIYGLMFKIASSNETPNGVPPDCPPLLADFFKQCFIRDAKQRPSAATMLQHPWMTIPDSELEEPGDDDLMTSRDGKSSSPGCVSPRTTTTSEGSSPQASGDACASDDTFATQVAAAQRK